MKRQVIRVLYLITVTIGLLSVFQSCKKEEDLLVSDANPLTNNAWISGVIECSGVAGGDSVTATVSGVIFSRVTSATPGGTFRLPVPTNVNVTVRIFNGSEDTTINVLSGGIAATTNIGFVRLCGNFNGLRIAAGGYHSLVVKPDGTLWAFGSNFAGQLGNNDSDRVVGPPGPTDYQNEFAPVRVGIANNWREVAAGTLTSYGLKGDGTSWSWGRDSSGSCGVGIGIGVDTLTWVRPQQNGSAISSIFSGYGFAAWRITTNNRELWACGGINCFSLPPPWPPIPGTVFPIQVGVDGGWSKVATFNFGAFAIKQDGTLWKTIPGVQNYLAQVGTETWLDVATGAAIRSDGTLWTLINNNWIQIPNTGTGWKMVSAWEGGHYMAIKSNGTLWGWGTNTYGQIGNGNTANISSPIQIGTDANWLDVSAGGSHTIATKTDGSVWTWGLNSSGQLGTGDFQNRLIPFQIYF